MVLTPHQTALMMMRNHASPELIEAYLALEIRRDPTCAMTPEQRFSLRIRVMAEQFREGVSIVARQLAEALGPLDKALEGTQSDYVRQA